MIKNLTQLKRALAPGAEFEITGHCRPEYVGQHRKVSSTNTSGFYSIIPEEPKSRVSTANCGKGSWLAWSKAPFWTIADGEAALYDSDEHHTDEHLIIKMKLAEGGAV